MLSCFHLQSSSSVSFESGNCLHLCHHQDTFRHLAHAPARPNSGRHWGIWPGSKVVIPRRLREGSFGEGKPKKLHPELHEGACSADSRAAARSAWRRKCDLCFFFLPDNNSLSEEVHLLSNQSFSSCLKQWKQFFTPHPNKDPTNRIVDAKCFHPSQMCDVWTEDTVRFFLSGGLCCRKTGY